MVSMKSTPISISDRSRASGPMIQTLRNILWVPNDIELIDEQALARKLLGGSE